MTSSIESRQQYAPWMAWTTWGCATAFFFFQFVVRVSPGVFSNELMLDLGITADGYSKFGLTYNLSYAMAQMFVGITLDRLGVRYPLVLAALLVLTGCLLMSVTDSFNVLLLARFMTGVGSALGFLSSVKTASMWFMPERLGLMIGLSILIGMVGAVFGGVPMAYLVNHLGWRMSMQVLVILAGLLCLVVLLLARDREEPLGHSLVEEVEHLSIADSLGMILKNPQTWLFALYGALMYVPMSAFADAWGVRYMMTFYEVDKLTAAYSSSITYIGLGASGPLLALVCDHWRSYKKVMMIGSLVTLLCYVIAIYFPFSSFELTYPLFFITGFAMGAQFFAFASVCELNPLKASATASGFQNMVNMIGGGLSIMFVGKLLDFLTEGKVEDVTARYTIPDFHIALAIVPISIALACVLLLFVREAYPPEEA